MEQGHLRRSGYDPTIERVHHIGLLIGQGVSAGFVHDMRTGEPQFLVWAADVPAPETILARRFGLKVAGLSVITNLAAGIEGASPSHEETKREGAKAAENMKALITRFFRDA